MDVKKAENEEKPYSYSVENSEHRVAIGYYKHVWMRIYPCGTGWRLQDAIASLLKEGTHQTVVGALLYALKIVAGVTSALDRIIFPVEEIKRLPELDRAV